MFRSPSCSSRSFSKTRMFQVRTSPMKPSQDPLRKSPSQNEVEGRIESFLREVKGLRNGEPEMLGNQLPVIGDHEPTEMLDSLERFPGCGGVAIAKNVKGVGAGERDSVEALFFLTLRLFNCFVGFGFSSRFRGACGAALRGLTLGSFRRRWIRQGACEQKRCEDDGLWSRSHQRSFLLLLDPVLLVDLVVVLAEAPSSCRACRPRSRPSRESS